MNVVELTKHTDGFNSVQASAASLGQMIRSTRNQDKLHDIRKAIKNGLELIEKDELHQEANTLYIAWKYGYDSAAYEDYSHWCEKADEDRWEVEEKYTKMLYECEAKIVELLEEELGMTGDHIIAIIEKIQLNNT